MADNKTLSPMDAIRQSKKMMYGYKTKYFYLMMRFIGWVIVGILTAGIGFLWIALYMKVSAAKFYDDLKLNVLFVEI
ncbi:MAG: DUF975 family protein [Candidatus Marinimicrobia bacterium]|nr:DUF975 family protein [Candidatus Neomarinimicrobiota bacterium]